MCLCCVFESLSSLSKFWRERERAKWPVCSSMLIALNEDCISIHFIIGSKGTNNLTTAATGENLAAFSGYDLCKQRIH